MLKYCTVAGQPRADDKTAHGIRLLNERALAEQFGNLALADYVDRMVRIQYPTF
jgi:hypothetical protein